MTLIANPANPCLTPALIALTGRVCDAGQVEWLAPGVACDLSCPLATDAAALRLALRHVLEGAAVDIVIQHPDERRKKILVADMDSTMIDQECIDELAAEIGVKDRVAAITERSMRGEMAFEPALRERVALLRGLETSVIDRVVAERLTLAAGGRELVATMRRNGAYAALVSGGFDAFTSPIATKLGFDEQRANRLLASNGLLTGFVAEPILGRAAKASALREVAAARGLSPVDVIAVGDGANDLDMIAIAGSGVAMHAKPIVADQAGFRIDHGDLSALLFMQGYRRDEFVPAVD